ncbi:MAG: hypothetical protein FWE37_09105, partial [Spirochaetaceae bacterium]|nr:hypothetical protein [Spirochaetaceae bacterium]
SDEQNRAISQLNSRFNNQTHGHTLSSGQAGFNEQALLVHNALTASPLLGQAAAANRSNLTMLSAAYFGQLESANGAHLTHQTQLLQQVRTALAANDGSIFLTANLYNLVLSGSQLTLRNQLATLAARVDTNEDSLITAGKALFLLAAVQTDNRPAERTALNNQLNELLSRVILLNRGLVLYRPALGKIELEAAIRTGYLLINASSISGLNRSAANNERFIGENLITTSLSFAGSNGFVPHYALWEGAGITYSANFFSYEHIAAYLWPSLFMPQVHSQHITMNAGQAVYTLANNVRTTWLSSSAINLELGVTPAHEHYLLFTGLPAIASVALNTANNQLTEVESLTGVSSGWLYNSDERTLYVRLPAGGGRQNLLINFAVNTPAPAATAASSQQVATGGPATTVSPAAAVIAAAEETAPATAEPERLTWAQRRALARQGN